MANLKLTVVVNKADGSLFYTESHEWPDVDATMQKWFDGKLDGYKSEVQKAANNRQSDGLSATFSRTGHDDFTVTGISYKELVRLERKWVQISDDLVKVGEERAKHK